MMSGQVCAMLSRAIVPRHRHDELADAIAGEMKQVRIGHSDDPDTQLGPLAMKRQLERVEMYIEEGRKSGADLVTGGRGPAHLNTRLLHRADAVRQRRQRDAASPRRRSSARC